MTETIEQAYARILKGNRDRQKKFYDLNKAKITQKKKDDRAELKELRAKYAAAPAAAVAAAAPCNECAAAAAPARRGKKGAKATPSPKQVAEKYDLPSILERVKQLVNDGKMDRGYLSTTKTLFSITGCDTLTKCLLQFNAIEDKIKNGTKKNGEPYALNSKKSFAQCIVKLITILDIPVSEALKQKYVVLMQQYCGKSNEQSEARKSDPEHAVMPYSEYMGKIKQLFKAGSKEYLIASLYNEVTCRDNYGGIQIVNGMNDIDKSTKQNYIVVPTINKQLCTVVIQSYKTEKRYGTINEKVSSGLSKQIRQYMDTHNLTDGDALFSNNKLSTFICDMNKKVGVTTGGSNFMRHSKITEMLDKQVLSEKSRLELALKMRHSPVSQLKYVRQVKWDGYDFNKHNSDE